MKKENFNVIEANFTLEYTSAYEILKTSYETYLTIIEPYSYVSG